MRLVVWNCNGRLDRKLGDLRALRPDLAVVPECACPEVLFRRVGAQEAGLEGCVWRGDTPSRGLAVLAFSPWGVSAAPGDPPGVETVLPVRVFGPGELLLIAVWARRRPPVRAAARALEDLCRSWAGRPTIVAGDFNRLLSPRSGVSRALVAAGFASASRGKPTPPTFRRLRRFPTPDPLDHVLVGPELADRIAAVEVHHDARWAAWSDHAPLVVEIRLAAQRT